MSDLERVLTTDGSRNAVGASTVRIDQLDLNFVRWGLAMVHSSVALSGSRTLLKFFSCRPCAAPMLQYLPNLLLLTKCFVVKTNCALVAYVSDPF